MNLSPNTLISTLGAAPQVITPALDLLIEQQGAPQQVVIIHTGHPRSRAAFDAIDAEFSKGIYGDIQPGDVVVRDEMIRKGASLNGEASNYRN